MAQFLNQTIPQDPPEVEDGFANIGKPIPSFRQDEAYRTCRKEFGMDANKSFSTVQGIVGALERDRPHEAMSLGMRHVDLTGVYRLFAVLLTHQQEKEKES